MAELELAETNQYLTFQLSEEIFALDIAKVREVLEYTKVTKVPQTPEMMIGVINLRGSVVPVIDLRLKFGMGMSERTVNTCIIIIEVSIDGEINLIGALVDSVKEVMDMDSDHIEPPPKIGTQLNTEFIKGMGKQNEQFVIILDIEKIFSVDELSMVQAVSNEASAVVEAEEETAS
ncbi:MAG: chemotaxis protein CheW [Proteobacteria bacterium]|nr:chemotaxis protein CheW [Pseudomonadota bacterium]